MKTCPHCKKPLLLRDYDYQEYYRRKVENAKASTRKAIANGNTKHGRNRAFDYKKIRSLRIRVKGKIRSMREIAKIVGCSTTTVQRALRERGE